MLQCVAVFCSVLQCDTMGRVTLGIASDLNNVEGEDLTTLRLLFEFCCQEETPGL